MKTSLSLICSVSIILASFLMSVAHAQNGYSFGDSGPASFSADLYGGQGAYGGPMGAAGPAGGPAGRRHGSAGGGIPGRLWLSSSFADRGLGYTGHYFTLGLKNRLFEDRFDGRWLFEGRVHHSLEDGGGLFTNIGLERIFSIDAARADVSMSVWYDYDGDARGNFAHDFNQIGASAQIKTPKWDLIGNGYFPIGTSNYSFGDPTGVNCFAGNRIVLIPGVDSALQGFDTVLRFRPAPLAMVNGTIDFGGYHYRSDLVDSFGGGKARMGFQVLRGAIVSAEVNHDDRFETTGVLSVGWLFGANASGRGHEYTPLGRDLESVSRNDHIVRYNREAVVLMNPLTGAPYNVIHVNNQANAAIADGTAERPFSTLLNGQNASAVNDVIAVGIGDGTDTNMDQGIVLKDGQRLWGVGVPFFVPNSDGTLFRLCGTNTTQRPTISNSGGAAVVTLANNNDVAGINIDGGGAQFGVLGSGNNGSVRENRITGASSHGVQIANASGDWRFDRNTLEQNGGSGLAIQNHFDNTSSLQITDNTARSNLMDGIMLQNVSPESLVIRGNTTSENVRHGLHINNFFATNSQPIVIDNHTSIGNLNRGIMIDRGFGSIQLTNSTMSDNIGAGFTLQNWNNLAGQGVLIGSATTPNTFLNNGAMGNIEILLTQAGLVNNVVVTGNRSDNGVRGLYARVEGFGVPTTLNIDILDNSSFFNNRNDGIAMDATDSGIINTRIASTVAGNRQPIIGNASGGGAGILLRANGVSGIPAGQINASIDNVFVSNRLNKIILVPDDLSTAANEEVALITPTTGIDITGLGNSLVNVNISNSRIGEPNQADRDTQGGIVINLDNEGSNLINRVRMDNLTTFNDVGLFVQTGEQTFADVLMQNSVLRPNGTQGNDEDFPGADNTPFVDPSAGTTGVLVQATGASTATGLVNQLFPDSDENVSGFETVTDGVLDNMTRITLVNNDIQDFHENGIDIQSFGDAQLLANITGNTVNNNGAGLNNDTDNDNVYDEPLPNGPESIDHLDFFDGIRLRAYDSSTLSANVFQNTIRDNFERGIGINTFNRATANISLKNNVLFGNDRGEDADNFIPLVFPDDPQIDLADAGQFDLEAINNAEFFIRPHHSRVVLDIDGVVVETPPGSGIPIFFDGNIGSGTPFDPLDPINNNGIARGAAELNLGMSSNSLQLAPPDFKNFGLAPGAFNVGLDGATNGFTAPFLSNFALLPIATSPITPTTLNAVDNLIANESNFFTASGF